MRAERAEGHRVCPRVSVCACLRRPGRLSVANLKLSAAPHALRAFLETSFSSRILDTHRSGRW
jgi:hypothetical protein